MAENKITIESKEKVCKYVLTYVVDDVDPTEVYDTLEQVEKRIIRILDNPDKDVRARSIGVYRIDKEYRLGLVLKEVRI